MKKILCLIDGIGFGGAQRQLIGLASFLQERGYRVELVAYHKRDFYLPLIKEKQLNYYLITCKNNRLSKTLTIIRLIKRNKYDVVISYLNGPNFLACITKFFNNTFKLIVSERVAITEINLQSRMRYFAYKKADYIVSNSYTQSLFIRKKFNDLSEKTKTITNFTDTSFFSPIAEIGKATEKPRKLSILVAGRIAIQKNIIKFLDTLSILKHRKVNIKVDWFGKVGYGMEKYSEETNKKVINLGLESIIEFHSGITNIREQYRQCDVFCLPSLREGYPNTICEAMSCGKPILCSRICDNPIIVEEGKNGMMFDPTSSEDMANTIERFSKLSIDEQMKMGKYSRELALQKFSSETFVNKYIEIIES